VSCPWPLISKLVWSLEESSSKPLGLFWVNLVKKEGTERQAKGHVVYLIKKYLSKKEFNTDQLETAT
jgi:hypothetical protein